METYKKIKGWDNYYISDMGNVYSNKSKKVLSPNIHYRNGYYSVNLKDKGKSKRYTIHSLVANHFLNKGDNTEINHKDGNKQNNNVSNLEWCNRLYNIIHSINTGLKKPTNKMNYNKKYYNSKTLLYVKDTSITEYISIKEMARNNNVNKTTIQKAIKRGGKFKGGFIYE